MVIKMNVPKLRFKQFKDEWNDFSLKNNFEYFSTNSLSREQLCNFGKIKNIHYGDIHKKYGAITLSDDILTYVKDQEYNNKYTICRNGDLILADASEDYEGIGKSTEVLGIINNNVISGLHTIHARDLSDSFVLGFKGYYFNSPIIHNQIRVLANGFKVFGISKDTINKLKINIPSKNEQVKIVETLQLLDKKIELQSQKIEALKLYKKGLINLVRNDWKNWKNYKISDIFKITRGVVIPKNKISEEKNEIYKYPVYSSQTSNNGILGYDKIYDYNGKYLTWTTDGANAGKVFYRDGKFRCTNVCGILYEDNPLFTNEFVCELLNYETPKHVSYVGNPKLMNNVMENINLKLPNNDILIKTAKLISLFNKKLENENDKLIKLHNLKKGLMQNMFV